MMSKRVYVNFARMIRTQKHKIIEGAIGLGEAKQFFDGAEKELNIIIDELVTIFKNDNENFNADKFLSACEIKEESK
jgi:hypothetical protein